MGKIKFRSFTNARKFARSLNLKSSNEWKEYCKSGKPDDIPTHTDRSYKNKGWNGWGDFLGNGNVPSKEIQFLPFVSARKYARTLKLKNTTAWNQYTKSGKLPKNIPARPNQTYKNKGWEGMPNWLDNGNISNKERQWVTFTDCKKFAKKNNITTQNEWAKFSKSGKRSKNIPAKPDREYKKQGLWSGWGDFLGTKRIANQNISYWSYEKSMKHIHSKKFKNQIEFRTAAKKDKLPSKIPKSPDIVYKNKGWTGWGEWLGTRTIANQTLSKNYLPLEEAEIVVRKLAKKYNLKSSKDWIKFTKSGKLPQNIPKNPWQVYPKKKKK